MYFGYSCAEISERGRLYVDIVVACLVIQHLVKL